MDKQQDIALVELGVSITKIPKKSAERDLKTWISGQELSTEEIQGLNQVFG